MAETANLVRFLGLIDDEGRKEADRARAFPEDDTEFARALADIVADAYSALFEVYPEVAWTLDRSRLTTFFRESDHTSELVGGRQAHTFEALARLCGKREQVAPRPRTAADARGKRPQSRKRAKATTREPAGSSVVDGNVGLTVRIEVNLPAQGDQETYDAIFRSIRENLLAGE